MRISRDEGTGLELTINKDAPLSLYVPLAIAGVGKPPQTAAPLPSDTPRLARLYSSSLGGQHASGFHGKPAGRATKQACARSGRGSAGEYKEESQEGIVTVIPTFC